MIGSQCGIARRGSELGPGGYALYRAAMTITASSRRRCWGNAVAAAMAWLKGGAVGVAVGLAAAVVAGVGVYLVRRRGGGRGGGTLGWQQW